ncbi:MAG: hypothetical protein VXW87_03930 [Pseudomonadota bacterium]|nr:hypothetical protein [Pseudomonadota bacterium]
MRYLRILVIVLYASTFAFDDVFEDIPSQFEGANVYFGVLSEAPNGLSVYDGIKFSNPIALKGAVEFVYQKESSLWVRGVVGRFAMSPFEQEVYEKNGSNKIALKSPWDVSIGYRLGFLFNPSTMVATNIGVGMAQESFQEEGSEVEADYYYLDTGLTMTLGVLTTWGVEMGVGARFRGDESSSLSASKEFAPPSKLWTSKFGLVYHREKV